MLGGGGGKEALAWRRGAVAGGWRTWECLGGFSAHRKRSANMSFRIIPSAPLAPPRGSVVPKYNPGQYTGLRTTGTPGNARVLWMKHA